jgi:hypothetical protein
MKCSGLQYSANAARLPALSSVEPLATLCRRSTYAEESVQCAGHLGYPQVARWRTSMAASHKFCRSAATIGFERT